MATLSKQPPKSGQVTLVSLDDNINQRQQPTSSPLPLSLHPPNINLTPQHPSSLAATTTATTSTTTDSRVYVKDGTSENSNQSNNSTDCESSHLEQPAIFDSSPVVALNDVEEEGRASKRMCLRENEGDPVLNRIQQQALSSCPGMNKKNDGMGGETIRLTLDTNTNPLSEPSAHVDGAGDVAASASASTVVTDTATPASMATAETCTAISLPEPTTTSSSISTLDFVNQRIAKLFRVRSTNRKHNGHVHKLFFGTVISHYPVPTEQQQEQQHIKVMADTAENNNNNATEKTNPSIDSPTDRTADECEWQVRFDDGDQAIFGSDALKRARSLYEENRCYDRRKMLSVRSDNASHDNDGKNDDTDLQGSDLQEKTPNPLSGAEKHGKQKKRAKGTSKANNTANTSAGSSKTTRLPPQMVWEGTPDECIDGGWPTGWIKRLYERKGGASKGHMDRYWYTPKHRYKLRSMVEVGRFMTALQQCNGDEEAAWKLFKGR
ncbi:methyl-CpG binding domain containing protein [Nitzschia inconspicua]|uniref:Methyl-CpG binding domain containing protein n=1 Tax=Nitzschia inconspicua TaxID=303405 RepID=A0A9K3KB51_9STRA|nr:methyl-CpG binding domain containing protein [Nitzschia inconspicua]